MRRIFFSLIFLVISHAAFGKSPFDIKQYVAEHYSGRNAKYCHNYVRLCGRAIDSGCVYLKKSDGSFFSSCGGLRRMTKEEREANRAVCPPPDLDCSDLCQSWESCVGERDIAGIKRFIKNKQSVNEEFDRGYTALHRTVTKENVEIVEILVNAGADVNAKSESGETPLFLNVTSWYPSPEIVKALLKAGADSKVKCKRGTETLTALEYIRLHPRSNPNAILHSEEIIKLLEEAEKNE